MASVIVPLVLQGLFAGLIKQADWWPGNKPGCVAILYVHDTAQYGLCMCVWEYVEAGMQAGRLRQGTEAKERLVLPHMPQI